MKVLVSVSALLLGVLFLGSNNASAQSAADGKKFFTESTCTSCHSLSSKKEPSHAGPALFGVTKRPGRTKEWLVSWISDPETVLKTDKLAQKLLKENNNVPMTGMLKILNKGDMAVVKSKAEAIYAFLVENDSKPDAAAADAGAKKKKN